jgi:hypothetical protein
MAYKITDKGKKAIEKYPARYKKLLALIAKEKMDVVEITSDYKNNYPSAKVKIHQLVVTQSGKQIVLGSSYQKSKADSIAKSLKDLVGSASATIEVNSRGYVSRDADF